MGENKARRLFGARLKAARQSRGLTQQKLGELAGLSEDVASTRINRYEKAVHDCDLELAHKISEVLGVPMAALYARDQLQSDLIAALDVLSGDEQEAMLENLRSR